MDDDRIRYEFARMKLTADLAKFREFIAQYESGLAFARGQVEDTQYQLGRLDQMLGSTDADS